MKASQKSEAFIILSHEGGLPHCRQNSQEDGLSVKTERWNSAPRSLKVSAGKPSSFCLLLKRLFDNINVSWQNNGAKGGK